MNVADIMQELCHCIAVMQAAKRSNSPEMNIIFDLAKNTAVALVRGCNDNALALVLLQLSERQQ